MASTPGVEPGPHWWEASALTTATPLLPKHWIALSIQWITQLVSLLSTCWIVIYSVDSAIWTFEQLGPDI